MLKRLLAVSATFLLTVASFAFAAEMRDDHPTTYVVQKGDTLWDIAGRFLQHPWKWPEIWQANPQVRNPHRIYPGDVLSLVYVDGRPQISASGPQIRVGESVDTIDLSEVEAFLKHMDVVDNARELPYVIGLEDDRLVASAGQVVYVRGLTGAAPGQVYEIGRPMREYYHSAQLAGVESTRSADLNFRARQHERDWTAIWTEFFVARDGSEQRRARHLGTEVVHHSVGEVTQVAGEITTLLLREESREVRVGDRLLPAEARPYDSQFMPHSPANVAAHAQILGVADGTAAGTRHVVALSVGKLDGVDNGTTFSVWHDGARRRDIVRHGTGTTAGWADKHNMPDSFLGHVMVFRTFDHVSYALVMDDLRPIRVGDLVKHPDAMQ